MAGGFSYNQSYHEVDASELKVTPEGISGTTRIIRNGDSWLRDPDWKTGGSLMGLMTLDVHFGEANDKGVYPVRGGWSVEWGLEHTRSGPVRGRLKSTQSPSAPTP